MSLNIKKTASIILLALAVGIILSGKFFIQKDFFKSDSECIRENEILRAGLQSAKINLVVPSLENKISAKVFSVYPFNNKNSIVLGAGQKDGVKKYAVVSWGENILIGQVSEVSDKWSSAKTVFDPDWQFPVRIGEKEIDGLLQGGSVPRIALISKDKEISSGDLVYSAGADLPYGIKIGEVGEIREKQSEVFKEAILKFPYNLNDLRNVQISP